MKITNNKNKANYVNFKDNGLPVKIMIPARTTVEILNLNNESQIINKGDFIRGFLKISEIVNTNDNNESKEIEKVKKTKSNKKNKEEDSLEKIQKEVKNYTDNEE